MKRINYPFSAIAGQDELILGLLLNAVNPGLGGILIKGTKGTGKSTAVYSFADIFPENNVNSGCKFQCNPDKPEEWCNDCKTRHGSTEFSTESKPVEIVNIPISTTEENLLGTVNIEKLLKEGEMEFVPGILSYAHRNILYIDEVNLLSDYIVDDILDVAATGWNRIKREGFTVEHPSRFILIGTMNPEEGELRPQILDRFPLSVTVNSVKDAGKRSEIIRRNIMFESDREKFTADFSERNRQLQATIKVARGMLNKVCTDQKYIELIVNLCSSFDVDGHRADIAILKTAQSHAALELRVKVDERHVRQAALLVLRHRTRQGGLKKPLTDVEINEFFDNNLIQESGNTSIIINKDMETPGGELLQLEKKS